MGGLDKWLDEVAGGEATMNQRQLAWAERTGGLTDLIEQGRAIGVHLAQFTDGKGHALLASSTKLFKKLC